MEILSLSHSGSGITQVLIGSSTFIHVQMTGSSELNPACSLPSPCTQQPSEGTVGLIIVQNKRIVLGSIVLAVLPLLCCSLCLTLTVRVGEKKDEPGVMVLTTDRASHLRLQGPGLNPSLTAPRGRAMQVQVPNYDQDYRDMDTEVGKRHLFLSGICASGSSTLSRFTSWGCDEANQCTKDCRALGCPADGAAQVPLDQEIFHISPYRGEERRC